MILEKFKTELAGRELTKQEGDFSLLMYCSVLPSCFPPYINKYYDFSFHPFVFIGKGKHGTLFFDLEDYRRVTAVTYERFLISGDQNDLLEYRDFIKAWEEVGDWFTRTSPENLAALDEESLYQAADKSSDLISRLLAATIFCESLDEELVRKYYLELGADETKFSHFFTIGSKLTFESFVARMDQALLNFKDSHNPAEIQWLWADYYSTPFIHTIPSLVEDLIAAKGGRNKIEAESKKIEAELLKNQQEVKDFRETLLAKERKLLDFMQLCMRVRDVRREPFQKALSASANVVREIYRREGLDPKEAEYSYVSDFPQRLPKRSEYREEIAKRQKGFVVFFGPDGFEFEYQNIEKTKQDLFSLMDNSLGKPEEVRGSIGCRGYAKGKVRVIRYEAEFSKFKAGDILVTSMTRPEFVPLMKRASAVITDEGGITCHAAIVSRELNIPCVIGTKNATRVLKDGDLVEVDADKGVVRIIK